MGAEKPIVVVGSINLDLVARATRIPRPGETLLGGEFAMHPGGKGANQAVAVARLGYPARMIGRVGSDGFGTQMRESLTRAGVDAEGVRISPGATGVAMIVVAETGENGIVVAPGANALLKPEDLDASLDILRSAAAVLAQLEVPLETVLHLAEICRREGISLMLDPAPARDLPDGLLEQVAWFTPNETEAAFYTGALSGADPVESAGALLRKGVGNIVLKLGARGAYLATGAGEPQRIDPFRMDSVDTTAAGDTFNGAFAVGLALGWAAGESARFANAAAALSTTRHGAQPSMPGRAEVERLLVAV